MNNAHVVDETANIMATLYDGTRLLAKLNWPHICGNAHLESTPGPNPLFFLRILIFQTLLAGA